MADNNKNFQACKGVEKSYERLSTNFFLAFPRFCSVQIIFHIYLASQQISETQSQNYYPHFTDEDCEAQKCEVVFPKYTAKKAGS